MGPRFEEGRSRRLVANRPTFTTKSGARLVSLLNAADPNAQVELTKRQRRVKRLALPDEGDRHVLVAAVSAEADILCTDTSSTSRRE